MGKPYNGWTWRTLQDGKHHYIRSTRSLCEAWNFAGVMQVQTPSNNQCEECFRKNSVITLKEALFRIGYDWHQISNVHNENPDRLVDFKDKSTDFNGTPTLGSWTLLGADEYPLEFKATIILHDGLPTIHITT